MFGVLDDSPEHDLPVALLPPPVVQVLLPGLLDENGIKEVSTQRVTPCDV